jgi:RNA polymerase sigma-70 factor (ECF subfamily)
MTGDDFLKLVRKYKAQIYQHALYLLGNQEDAEDITQETFVKAWEHRANLRSKTVHSWLLKCAQNLCFNLLKRHKFQMPLAEGDDAELEALLHTHTHQSNPAPDELVVNQELKELVHRAISKLPPDMRVVIVMRELDGMSFKEIAMVTKQPEGTVKSTVFRARKKLRELLRPYWRNDE